jgi:predicted small metal-binding protein
MKLLSCHEVGVCDCDFIVTGETEEQVTISATEHVMKEHRKTLEDMLPLRDRIEELICTILYD